MSRRVRQSASTPIGKLVDEETQAKLAELSSDATCPFSNLEALELLREAIRIYGHATHVGRPEGALRVNEDGEETTSYQTSLQVASLLLYGDERKGPDGQDVGLSEKLQKDLSYLPGVLEEDSDSGREQAAVDRLETELSDGPSIEARLHGGGWAVHDWISHVAVCRAVAGDPHPVRVPAALLFVWNIVEADRIDESDSAELEELNMRGIPADVLADEKRRTREPEPVSVYGLEVEKVALDKIHALAEWHVRRAERDADGQPILMYAGPAKTCRPAWAVESQIKRAEQERAGAFAQAGRARLSVPARTHTRGAAVSSTT